MLDRGKLIVGTGSTNAPWHFEDDKGQLTGMDITMARILAKGLFDDPTKVEFVKQEPAARIPNITTGKVDIVIQFMTISPARAQLVAFSRPYYVEGVALLTSPKGKLKTFKQLMAGRQGCGPRSSRTWMPTSSCSKRCPRPRSCSSTPRPTSSRRSTPAASDAAVVDLSTVRWLVKRGRRQATSTPGTATARSCTARPCARAIPTGSLGQHPFTVAMFGHQSEIYDKALEEFFGEKPPDRKPGFPPI